MIFIVVGFVAILAGAVTMRFATHALRGTDTIIAESGQSHTFPRYTSAADRTRAAAFQAAALVLAACGGGLIAKGILGG